MNVIVFFLTCKLEDYSSLSKASKRVIKPLSLFIPFMFYIELLLVRLNLKFKCRERAKVHMQNCFLLTDSFYKCFKRKWTSVCIFLCNF